MRRIIFLIILSCSSYYGCFSQKNDTIIERFVIVLDIQEYYTSNDLSDSASQNLIDSVNYVINNTDSDHVIYVKSNHKVLNISSSYPFIYVSFDSAAMQFDKRLNIVNDNIFIKESPSAFSQEDLNNFLNKENAKEIIIIGLMAEKCVYKSYAEGLKIGYDMYIIPSAIAGNTETRKNK